MIKTAQDRPGVFFATCARLIGPEVKLTIEQTLPGNLSMEDWQLMREIVAAVRQAIPDAANAPPGKCCLTFATARMKLGGSLPIKS